MSIAHRPWATERFGLRLHDGASGHRLTALVQPGLRRNPRRAHLLVSTVLGKHIAVPPAVVRSTARQLGDTVAALHPGDADVLGMAETATGLGHCVADQLDAPVYVHSTRRPAPSAEIYAEFQEGHSHATDHLLLPAGSTLLDQPRTLVIVDDEISTGKTALAAIDAIHRRFQRPGYIVAALVDVRTESHRKLARTTARALGTRIEFVSLAQGRVSTPLTLTEQVCALDAPTLNPVHPDGPGGVKTVNLRWPANVPDGGRHGLTRADSPAFSAAVVCASAEIAPLVDPRRPLLVVGHEELMYLPLRIAEQLAACGFNTRFQSTTRSPAYVFDDPGYPLRGGFEFPASESDQTGYRYLYNGWPTRVGGMRAQAVIVLDAAAAVGIEGLASKLTAAGYDIVVAIVDGAGFQVISASRDGR